MPLGMSIPNQERLLEPFSQRLYSGDLNYTKSYIHKYFNEITGLVGKDCIVNGFDVKNYSFTNFDITITINPGYIIHDKAFIEVDDEITLTYPNASSFDSNGKFIVFSRFKNYITMEENKFTLGMMYLNSDGTSHEPFNQDSDRIILSVCSFTKDGSGYINGLTLLDPGLSIIINGITYSIAPNKEATEIESSLDGGILP